jgi:vanadium chloroperoxidase
MDSILFWNAVALEANRVSHTDPDKREQNGPTLSSRALAIVHLAMYDAYAGIVGGGGFPRYLNPPPAPAGTSARDAVAGAAYRTLSALYSTQADYFKAQLSCFDQTNPSFGFGQDVAKTLLGDRSNDLDSRSCGYRFSNNRGRHRVDPDNPDQGFDSPFYGVQNRGFAVSKRHTLKPPPFSNGTDLQYLQALEQVRKKGIKTELSAKLPPSLFDDRRDPMETLIGEYWSYDGTPRLGTPPRLYNQIVRLVAAAQGNNEGQNARLFAFVNAAMADAGIMAWEQKYCHDFWRPVVGIREHDLTLGPLAPYPGSGVDFADGDPGWLPLGAQSTNNTGKKNFTPNFPSYPSGHATFGAAALHMTRMFYGIDPNDKTGDTLLTTPVISDEFNGGNRDNQGTVRPRHARSFEKGLWAMIMENATSRIFLGVHWIFDAFDFKDTGDGNLVPDLSNESIGGVPLGLRVARDIFANGGGLAPKMTLSSQAVPLVITPAAGSPMVQNPRQPASIGGCADRRFGGSDPVEGKDEIQEPYPDGISDD